ncbi:hypothetical protein CRYUN_Cryun12cG0127500 [Craigia yunnanensis]
MEADDELRTVECLRDAWLGSIEADSELTVISCGLRFEQFTWYFDDHETMANVLRNVEERLTREGNHQAPRGMPRRILSLNFLSLVSSDSKVKAHGKLTV